MSLKKPRKKKCKVCNEVFQPERQMQPCCSIKCAILKVQIDKKAKFDKETRLKKEAIKPQSKWRSEAQALFNKMRRLEELLWFKERGIEPYCISCQKPLGSDQWCNGHFKTRGARPDLAFDKMNSYLQHNVRCNMALSGDIEGYKKGLVIRFGELEAENIINYCEIVQDTPKRTVDDWKKMKKEFRAEIKRLQSLL